MKIYHEAWLEAHPWRTKEWLRAHLEDGFAIHHIDGNHENNDPRNLLLCEGSDHMQLHGMPLRQQARRASLYSARKKRKIKEERPRLTQWDRARLSSQLGPPRFITKGSNI